MMALDLPARLLCRAWQKTEGQMNVNFFRCTTVGVALICVFGGGWGNGSSAATPPSGPTTATREALVWSDEFTATAAKTAPNPANWTYEVGADGWGNHELEDYCAYSSTTAPCDPANPNAFVGNDGYLHIIARKDAKGSYTSARMKTQGLQSFQYGRMEARIKMPVGQGIWPAFWTLGDNITTVNWPACGEMDIMETIGSTPGVNTGSIHGVGFTGTIGLGKSFTLPAGAKFSDAFHTFGMIWSPKSVNYYIDDPTNIYATYTPASLPAGRIWPFEGGKQFFLLNVAIGGDWPGSPDATTVFPQEMLVDYVRVYVEPGNPLHATTAAPVLKK
jgi:beta-glucanase (GH16 family)